MKKRGWNVFLMVVWGNSKKCKKHGAELIHFFSVNQPNFKDWQNIYITKIKRLSFFSFFKKYSFPFLLKLFLFLFWLLKHMFKITPQLYEKIKHFARFPQTGVSLKQMVMFGKVIRKKSETFREKERQANLYMLPRSKAFSSYIL